MCVCARARACFLHFNLKLEEEGRKMKKKKRRKKERRVLRLAVYSQSSDVDHLTLRDLDSVIGDILPEVIV